MRVSREGIDEIKGSQSDERGPGSEVRGPDGRDQWRVASGQNGFGPRATGHGPRRVSRKAIDEIKQRNDIAEVAMEHGIELKKRGRTLFGLCPFHEEKTPSFTVNRELGLFHCFGCGVGGDVIGFVVRFHGVTFREAMRRLAVRAGVELEPLMEMSESLSSRDDVMRRIETKRFERFSAHGGRP
jgi:hypothetical protein